MELVTDLIECPITVNPYTALKARLVTEYEETPIRKAKKLLTELQLEDRKSLALLKEIRNLAVTKIKDEFLRCLFVQRLPEQASSILTASNDDLDTLAVMADKIVEVTHPTHVFKTTITSIPCTRSLGSTNFGTKSSNIKIDLSFKHHKNKESDQDLILRYIFEKCWYDINMWLHVILTKMNRKTIIFS